MINELDNLEQLAELIIEDKWSDLTDSIDKIYVWKNSINKKIFEFRKEINIINGDFENLHKDIVSKIRGYEDYIFNLEKEVKKLKDLLIKNLPLLKENINEIARINKKLKTKRINIS